MISISLTRRGQVLPKSAQRAPSLAKKSECWPLALNLQGIYCLQSSLQIQKWSIDEMKCIPSLLTLLSGLLLFSCRKLIFLLLYPCHIHLLSSLHLFQRSGPKQSSTRSRKSLPSDPTFISNVSVGQGIWPVMP